MFRLCSATSAGYTLTRRQRPAETVEPYNMLQIRGDPVDNDYTPLDVDPDSHREDIEDPLLSPLDNVCYPQSGRGQHATRAGDGLVGVGVPRVAARDSHAARC